MREREREVKGRSEVDERVLSLVVTLLERGLERESDENEKEPKGSVLSLVMALERDR